MSAYVARRLIQSLVVLLGISVVVFIILHLTGDPTLLMLPPDASAEEVTRFRRAMGFDDPQPVQYWRFLRGVLQGNFGNSLRHDEPAQMTYVHAAGPINLIGWGNTTWDADGTLTPLFRTGKIFTNYHNE